MNSAARKIFLGDGTPVTSPQQISKDEEVFISMGEPFKNAYISLQGENITSDMLGSDHSIYVMCF